MPSWYEAVFKVGDEYLHLPYLTSREEVDTVVASLTDGAPDTASSTPAASSAATNCSHWPPPTTSRTRWAAYPPTTSTTASSNAGPYTATSPAFSSATTAAAGTPRHTTPLRDNESTQEPE
jgi:hypothetical protein